MTLALVSKHTDKNTSMEVTEFGTFIWMSFRAHMSLCPCPFFVAIGDASGAQIQYKDRFSDGVLPNQKLYW